MRETDEGKRRVTEPSLDDGNNLQDGSDADEDEDKRRRQETEIRDQEPFK